MKKLDRDEFNNSKHIFIKDQDTLDKFTKQITELSEYYKCVVLDDYAYLNQPKDVSDILKVRDTLESKWQREYDKRNMYNVYNTQIIPSDYSKLINFCNIFKLQSSKPTKNELLLI